MLLSYARIPSESNVRFVRTTDEPNDTRLPWQKKRCPLSGFCHIRIGGERWSLMCGPMRTCGCRPLNGIHLLTGFFVHIFYRYSFRAKCPSGSRGPRGWIRFWKQNKYITLYTRYARQRSAAHLGGAARTLYARMYFCFVFSPSPPYRFVFIYFLVEKITDFSGRRVHATSPAGQLPPPRLLH